MISQVLGEGLAGKSFSLITSFPRLSLSVSAAAESSLINQPSHRYGRNKVHQITNRSFIFLLPCILHFLIRGYYSAEQRHISKPSGSCSHCLGISRMLEINAVRYWPFVPSEEENADGVTEPVTTV